MPGPFKMKGHTLPGPNQVSPMKQTLNKKTIHLDRRPTNNPKYKASNTRIAGPGTRKLTVEAANKIKKIGKFIKGGSLAGAVYGLFKGWGKGHMKKGYSKPPTIGKI